jgi:hypothetical protein
MAWYGDEWREPDEFEAWRPGGPERGRTRGARGGRAPGSWSGRPSGGYGGAYSGRAPAGWRSPRPGGTGYDYGFQGGEWGRPVNAPSFGTRGSYGTPRRGGPAEHPYRARYRTEPIGYDREFGQGSERGRWIHRSRGASAGPDYTIDYDEELERLPGYDREYRRARTFGPGQREASDDFGGSLRRHYGRTPPDRWPARAAGSPRRRLDDRDIRDAVRENLFHDSFIAPERIQVAVDRGVVTLRGEVDGFLEARYAWDDAWESPGVRGVINHLTVRTDRAADEMDMPQSTGGASGRGEGSGGRLGGRGSGR